MIDDSREEIVNIVTMELGEKFSGVKETDKIFPVGGGKGKSWVH